MNRRTRKTLPQNTFHKYLKPGALARIRDSRINARSHRLDALLRLQIRAPSPPPDQPPSTATTTADTDFPFFVSRFYGPRCPQRKKLMASKSVIFLPVSPAVDSPDLVINALGTDLLIAN